MAGRPRLLTQEQQAWVAERYADTTNAELVNQIEDEFGVTLTTTQLSAWAKRNELKKGAEALARTRVAGREKTCKYTDEMRDFMRMFVPGHVYPETAAEFERRFGWRISKTQYKNLVHKLGVRSGVRGYGCYKPGHEPANKGKTWDDFMSPEAQQRIRESGNLFKKGQKSANAYHELLDVRHDKDGWWIYVKPRNAKYQARNWIPLSQYVWMQHNGREFPADCRCVHCDHDPNNNSPENLMAVPESVYGIITGNRYKAAMEYWDRESLKVAIIHAKLVHTVLEKKRRRKRRCSVCGKLFVPDEKRLHWGERVRTCSECTAQGRTRKKRRETA